MATRLDYFEFRCTKPNGDVIYSEATQHILPPLIDQYQTVEQINHYTNGSTDVRIVKGEKS